MARRTKEDASATRNALLDAAELVFYERGVARATLAEIAQAAGASRGAIYWHFKDKVDLFHAMADRATLPLEDASTSQRVLCLSNPLDRLQMMLSELLGIIETNDRARRVLEIAIYRVEYVTELSAVRERHLAAHARLQDLMAQDLQLAAQQSGKQLPVDVVTAARGLHTIFDGLLHSWLLMPVKFELSVVGRDLVKVYLRGLGFVLD